MREKSTAQTKEKEMTMTDEIPISDRLKMTKEEREHLTMLQASGTNIGAALAKTGDLTTLGARTKALGDALGYLKNHHDVLHYGKKIGELEGELVDLNEALERIEFLEGQLRDRDQAILELHDENKGLHEELVSQIGKNAMAVSSGGRD